MTYIHDWNIYRQFVRQCGVFDRYILQAVHAYQMGIRF